jgi:ubiquinone/menaquinone biosynthesis C-methylase UbiE
MPETSRHDAWQAGDSYDAYMGRWSRQIVLRFLDWLHAPDGLDWLEVGCGTGALSAAILAQCDPKSLIAIDQSEGFIRKARAKVPDTRAEFRVGDAQGLPAETASRDVIASALVLNFVPDRQKALSEMKRVARAGAKMGLYVWDSGRRDRVHSRLLAGGDGPRSQRSGPYRRQALSVLDAQGA